LVSAVLVVVFRDHAVPGGVCVEFPARSLRDEAYYWDWGRQLSWGYFSKPPLIAWLMALAGWFADHSDAGIRLMAVVLGSGSLLFTYALARQFWGNKVGFWTAVLVVAAPGNAALNLILTIDAPLVFFWSGALFSFYQLVHGERRRWFWAVMTTLLLGLGLLSKQMMLAFYGMGILYLATTPGLRSHLRRKDIWITWIVSLLFMVPTLVWNATNQWITVSHTQHHFEGKSLDLLAILARIGEFFGSQLGVLSPVTAIALFLVLYRAGTRFRALDSRARYLLCMGLPGLLSVVLLLFRQSINPNWPAVFYISLLPLLAAAMVGAADLPTQVRMQAKAWLKASWITGAAFAALTLILPHLLIWSGHGGAKWDPTARLQGWSALAETVHKVREIESDGMERPFLLVAGHRYTASQLAFYLIDQPRVYRWPDHPGKVESQYELWGIPDFMEGADAIVILPGLHTEPEAALSEAFLSIELLQVITIPEPKKRPRNYTLYIGKTLQLSAIDQVNRR
jgi:4-amino-4-deoxy-L-arabinose transferase-like glycosyltransferase